MPTWPDLDKLIKSELSKEKVQVVLLNLPLPDKDKVYDSALLHLSNQIIQAVREGRDVGNIPEVVKKVIGTIPPDAKDFSQFVSDTQITSSKKFLELFETLLLHPEVQSLVFRDPIEFVKYIALCSIKAMRQLYSVKQGAPDA